MTHSPAMSRLSELGGKRLPFLRWSVLRLAFGMKKLTSEWQVGDGREEALARFVAEHARRGDVDDTIRVIDEFCYTRSFMINVGDEKGAHVEYQSLLKDLVLESEYLGA